MLLIVLHLHQALRELQDGEAAVRASHRRQPRRRRGLHGKGRERPVGNLHLQGLQIRAPLRSAGCAESQTVGSSMQRAHAHSAHAAPPAV